MSSALVLLGLVATLLFGIGVLRGRMLGVHGRVRNLKAVALALGVLLLGAAATPTVDAPEAQRTRPGVSTAPSSTGPAPTPTDPALSRAPLPAGVPVPSALPGPPRAGSALTLLAGLEVKGRGPRTGYTREAFGQPWLDTDRNGCDTRNDVLRRDLVDLVLRAGTSGCVVEQGTLQDPYTGRRERFRKATASAVQIDHVVSLSDAWQTGAAGWSPGKRWAFANDPLNLLAVDGPTNQLKGDGDTATWLPPHKPGRCPMVARQVAVKAAYQLWVKPAERDAMVRVLQGCRGEPAPSGSAPTEVPVPRSAAPPAEQGPGAPGGQDGLDPDHGSCRNAKAAGAGPYEQGRDPEYDWYRDGDGDGTVCE